MQISVNIIGKMSNLYGNLKEGQKILLECALLGALIIVFFKNIILWGVVPSESMEPTINIADVVLINGLAYFKEEPQRGDIVIFDGAEGDMAGQTLVKRIIGLPGDSIMFVDGYIYINGEFYNEEYIDDDVETNSFKDFEVPDNCYFVLGDNRMNSFDSRYWNNPYITIGDIKGKLMTIIPISWFNKRSE